MRFRSSADTHTRVDGDNQSSISKHIHRDGGGTILSLSRSRGRLIFFAEILRRDFVYSSTETTFCIVLCIVEAFVIVIVESSARRVSSPRAASHSRFVGPKRETKSEMLVNGGRRHWATKPKISGDLAGKRAERKNIGLSAMGVSHRGKCIVPCSRARARARGGEGGV